MVIKLGGSVMDRLHPTFFDRCVELKRKRMLPVIVHGGGPMISEWMGRVGKIPQFVEGRRVTDEETLSIVEMVLAGGVNKGLVTRLAQAGASALGISGVDLGILKVKPLDPKLGYVGEVIEVNREALYGLLEQGWIPVIATLGMDGNGQHYNINADEAAGAIAEAIGAKKLVLVTDVDGICDEREETVPFATPNMVERWIQNGTITGGMIPKARSGLRSLRGSVEEVRIINGMKPHPNGWERSGTCLIKEEVGQDDALSQLSSS